jgi:hypothetical protein
VTESKSRSTISKVLQSAAVLPLAFMFGLGRGYDTSAALVAAVVVGAGGAALTLAAVHGLRLWWHDFGAGRPAQVRMKPLWSVVVSAAAAVACVVAISVISDGP